ncbi:glycosyltransferase [Polluticaenibacter yanchengensis]|uniref:Glycosyltransferase n=1 Tax=Polluticaenibacter yanchengensis TaxID=3014562 RepID=A0ABT4UPJ9_9BACT|nr:glycosyltransferase [Chitinophagaceae bacterium LY-5]
MQNYEFNTANANSLNVLIAPLDWGLGHTTRCIPVVKALLQRHCNVFIACNHWQQSFLERECGNLTYIKLEGYNIQYSKNRLFLKIASQSLKIKKRIKAENKVLEEILTQYNIDWIISDNRYGLFHPKVFSTIITHQLQLQLPGWLSFFQPVANKFIKKYLAHFNNIWVPDNEGQPNMGGCLSHSSHTDLPLVYIGSLGRFKPGIHSPDSAKKVAVILSGIEPQRSILESVIMSQAGTCKDFEFTLVRGTNNGPDTTFTGCKVVNIAGSRELETILNNNSIIICRSGYSSVMDYLPLNKTCIFIPTPGQTEQEYLADYLSAGQLSLAYKQAGFDLEKALKEASGNRLKTFLSVPALETAIDASISYVVKRKNG